MTAASRRPSSTRLTTGPGQFILDGQPFQILSGEMHYPRIPRQYWRDRLRKARAMGLNTVSTYVFWNLHEPSPGRFDFTGQKDVAAFVRLAGQEGLHVIVRPGPYVCAEWDLGGYPAWLLADESLVLRSTDLRFTTPAARWLNRLGRELAPLLGDPVIAVQVENEYGSFDKDKGYLEWQRGALLHAGFGKALLFTSDGPSQLPNGTLPDVPAVVNFGTGGAENAFQRLAAFRPGGPMMTGEYWAGWFDHWGRSHARTNLATQVRELAWMLDRGYSINLYMFHGGTTFGFMNGANIDNSRYHPQTTSYDYDAALNESGRLTPKYFAFRDAIAAHVRSSLPAVPASSAPISIGPFELARTASLWTGLPRGLPVDRPKPMETFGQSYGYILYRTRVSSPVTGDLIVRDVRDYAQIYVNRRLTGTIDRRLNQDRVPVIVPAGGADIDILVENSGRVNFNKALREERKGITRSVTLGDRELTGWTAYPLPMSTVPHPRWGSAAPEGPAFYRGVFTVSASGDTFLDTRGWGKGTVWVNGHHLGRFWDIGPQQTLYVPGPWLRAGSNEVVVFALSRPQRRTMAGLSTAVFSNQAAPYTLIPSGSGTATASSMTTLSRWMRMASNRSIRAYPIVVPRESSRHAAPSNPETR
jgi:beta-galactosidase